MGLEASVHFTSLSLSHKEKERGKRKTIMQVSTDILSSFLCSLFPCCVRMYMYCTDTWRRGRRRRLWEKRSSGSREGKKAKGEQLKVLQRTERQVGRGKRQRFTLFDDIQGGYNLKLSNNSSSVTMHFNHSVISFSVHAAAWSKYYYDMYVLYYVEL